MRSGLARLLGAVALFSLLGSSALAAAELVPYRARYTLTLASSKPDAGIAGAGGAIIDEWNETCDGWTEQEHFYLHLAYDEEDAEDDDAIDVYSMLVSWEARDASRFRFDMRRSSTDAPFEEIKGTAKLGGPGASGTAEFARPAMSVLPLGSHTLFPAAYTRLLIARAEAGERLVTRNFFDGSDVDDGSQITAVIGRKLAAAAAPQEEKLPASPLLDRPSWRIRLAFFPPGRNLDQTPEHEESVRLLDNGVMQELLFDYGNYSIRASLDRIEPLPRPRC